MKHQNSLFSGINRAFAVFSDETGTNTMQMKPRRKQDDRLLKQLSRAERARQEQIRRQIFADQLFKTV